ncbi:MAG TPA: carbon monoxide dehydrogenase subunit G [Stellaceae bacterium]|nr:carbon monoxide dehydrogenase subunit G [Stellaceae bacterium]
MEMTGEFRIPAPRERVWQGLNDPEILKQAIPGCQTIEKVSDTEFTARVRTKVGPVSATFGGKVNLTDLDPPKAYTISGEGSGGVAGFAKGSAKVSLDADGGEATVLHYEVQAHVGGKLAQIGSRLIDATSRKMAEDFFSRFVAAVSPPAPGNGGAEEAGVAGGSASEVARTALAPESPGPQSGAAEGTMSRRLPPAVWVTGLTAIVGLMLYYFTRSSGIR